MIVQVPAKIITDDDLLALGEDVHAEVIDGEIVITMAAHKLENSVYAQSIGTFLDIFVKLRGLGRVASDMTPFKMEVTEEGGIKGALIPDVSYISYARLPMDADMGILPDFAPDLAIEVISESETATAIIKKTYYYLDHGAVQVWQLYPSLPEIRVYTPENRAGIILGLEDTLTGGDLLLGFAVPVRAIFDVHDSDLYAAVLQQIIVAARAA